MFIKITKKWAPLVLGALVMLLLIGAQMYGYMALLAVVLLFISYELWDKGVFREELSSNPAVRRKQIESPVNGCAVGMVLVFIALALLSALGA